MYMKISAISFTFGQNRKKSPINTKTTGYGAVCAMILTLSSGYSKNKSFRQSHKYFAGASAALIALHIFLVESYKIAYRKNKK